MSETSQSRKPKNSPFEQQRLAAWQPILTAGTVMPTFFLIGVVFIPVGIFLLSISNLTQEIVIDYTDCESTNLDFTGNSNSAIKPITTAGTKTTRKGNRADPRKSTAKLISTVATPVSSTNTSHVRNKTLCKDIVKPGNIGECVCQIPFEVTKSFLGTVFVYYALTKFYQNHRRYLSSYDDKQLRGVAEAVDFTKANAPSADCDPFRYVNSDKNKGIYFPCGAVANSFFTDVISIMQNGSKISLTSEGIVWDSDLKYKFKNPTWWKEAKNNPSHPAWRIFKKPKDWKKQLWELEDGLLNKDLIVWMRRAALPNFRKLYRVVNDPKGISKGNYTLYIKYAFPVAGFGGTKSVVIATTSIIGGKNPFIGIAYIVVGTVCLVLTAVFMTIHIHCGTRKLQSITPNVLRSDTPSVDPSGDTLTSKGNDSLDGKHGGSGKKKSN